MTILPPRHLKVAPSPVEGRRRSPWGPLQNGPLKWAVLLGLFVPLQALQIASRSELCPPVKAEAVASGLLTGP